MFEITLQQLPGTHPFDGISLAQMQQQTALVFCESGGKVQVFLSRAVLFQQCH